MMKQLAVACALTAIVLTTPLGRAGVSFVKVAQTGGTFYDFGWPHAGAVIRADGHVVFTANTDAHTPFGLEGVFAGDGGAPRTIYGALPDLTPFVTVNGAGTLCFSANYDWPGPRGIFKGAGETPTQIWTIPEGGGGYSTPASINASGRVALLRSRFED